MATITVTGHLKNSFGVAIPNGTVQFLLTNYGGNLPQVLGTNVLVPIVISVTADGTGFFTTTIQGNDTITPASTIYQVTYNNSITASYTFTGSGPINLDSYPPLNQIPVPQGAVPANILTSNNVFTGTNAFNSTTTFNSNVQFLASNIFSGAQSFSSINGIVYSDQQIGATLDVRLNACITAAIALPPHICNASGEGGTQTIAAQVNVGTNSPINGVTLLLPSQGTWNITITDGVSCGIAQFGGTSIIGPGPVTGANLNITGSASANLKAFYCTDPNPVGGGQYVRAEGFQLYNPNGSTVTTALMDVEKTFDNSLFSRITISNYSATDGLRVYSACCGTSFTNVTSNSNGTGKRPVFIQADTSLRNHEVNFYSLSADHPGSGFASVEISGGKTPPTDGVNSGINFYGLFTEETTTNPNFGLKIVDARGINIFGWEHNNLVGGATATGLDISQTASNQVRAINVFGYHFVGASGTGINNHITGKTFGTSTTYFSGYKYGGAVGSQANQPENSEDVDHIFYDGLGNAIYTFATSSTQGGAGNTTIRNFLDQGISLNLDSGLTAAQTVNINFRDQGVNQWGIFKDSGQLFSIRDAINATNRIQLPQAANIATGGLLRGANTDCHLGWRNNANSANILLCKDTSDKLTFNSVVVPTTPSSTSSMRFLGCGTTSTCAQTNQSTQIILNGGPIALAAGTLTVTSLPFTSSTTYVCSADDSTGINGIDVIYNSGSSVTFNGTGTDSIRYSCIGN